MISIGKWYCREPKKHMRKKPRASREFSKIVGCEINKQKLIIFMYTKNNQIEDKMKGKKTHLQYQPQR